MPTARGSSRDRSKHQQKALHDDDEPTDRDGDGNGNGNGAKNAPTPAPALGQYIYPKNASDLPLNIVRTLLLVQTLVGASAWGVGSAPLLSLVGRTDLVNRNAAVAVKFIGDRLLGVRVTMDGREHFAQCGRPAVFVCNHQAMLDLYMLGYVLPEKCVVMAKDELFYAPFIGQQLYFGNNIFISRENQKSAFKTMRYVSNEMKRRKLGLFMYPEGTRSNQTTNDLLPFKKGAFRLAIDGQFPVVPIVISTYGDVSNPKQGLFRGGKVHIRVLPPISTEGMTVADVGSLTESTRDLMLKTLREISRPIAKL
ncbi:hypothetical protein DFJ73DRAFT_843573 [Zopfochytrium polystomum]|nr:hypothetical protein DFJ73DRAFT_843573 [Zopfochytrium polystomum]